MGEIETTQELTVVMPVYNEEAGVVPCVRSWVRQLEDLGIDFEIAVYNDGSRDGTEAALEEAFVSDCRVRVTSKPNEGHGPTILHGYREAVTCSTWVCQVDSDDEIFASSFPALWAEADQVDAVFGIRVGRDQPIDRRIISVVAGFTTRALFRSRVRDVNVPFRLIRAEVLAPVVAGIPPDTFAPNLVISGALGRAGVRLRQVDVPFTARRTGTVSIAGLGALRAAVRSFFQTARLARRFR